MTKGQVRLDDLIIVMASNAPTRISIIAQLIFLNSTPID